MKRIIVRLSVVLVLGLIALSVAGITLVPPAARTAVAKGTEYALGVPATIGAIHVSLGLPRTSVGFDEYVLSSPEGFEEPLLSIGHFNVGVGTTSLVGDVKVIDTLALEDVTLTLEQRGTSNNLVPILQHLRGLGGGDEPGAAPAPGDAPAREGAPGPRLRIGTVRFSGIAARLRLGGIPGVEEFDQRFEVPAYERDWSDLTGGDGKTVAEIAGLIVQDLEEAALDAADGKVPEHLLAALKSTLRGGLDGGLGGGLDAAREALGAEGQRQADKLKLQVQEEADSAASKAQGELEKELKGLLPGGDR